MREVDKPKKCRTCAKTFFVRKSDAAYCSRSCNGKAGHKKPVAVLPRFEKGYHPEPNTGCWIWMGGAVQGYGVFNLEGQSIMAHRVSKLLYEGYPIATSSHQIHWDHICRVRLCVNPRHLRLVSAGENIRAGEATAGKNSRKTHCKNGHPFSGENLKINKNGARVCVACVNFRNALLQGRRRTAPC